MMLQSKIYLLEEFKLLSEKCNYFENEYNKFDLYPSELTKKDLNLNDKTKTIALLTEENLKIKLAEKHFVRDELLNSVSNLHKQITLFEEKQKEIKEKEKLYGKPLSAISNKFKKNNKIKKIENNNLNTKSNLNTNFTTTSSNRRTRTIPSKRKKSFFS